MPGFILSINLERNKTLTNSLWIHLAQIHCHFCIELLPFLWRIKSNSVDNSKMRASICIEHIEIKLTFERTERAWKGK